MVHTLEYPLIGVREYLRTPRPALHCSRESDACWWCGRPEASQTREHIIKPCPAWRERQKVLWKEVRKQAKRGRDRFRMADLFADERCSKAVLRFLETMGIGKTVPKERPTEEDSDASSSGLCIGT